RDVPSFYQINDPSAQYRDFPLNFQALLINIDVKSHLGSDQLMGALNYRVCHCLLGCSNPLVEPANQIKIQIKSVLVPFVFQMPLSLRDEPVNQDHPLQVKT